MELAEIHMILASSLLSRAFFIWNSPFLIWNRLPGVASKAVFIWNAGEIIWSHRL